MSKIIPFSDLSKVAFNSGEEKYCLLDTNFALAVLHYEHSFYTDTQEFFKQASAMDFSFFITHTARTEFLDVERRFLITRPLVDLYEQNGKWKGKVSAAMSEALMNPAMRIKQSKDLFDSLRDHELKTLKEVFFPYNESGKVGWINFCSEFLNTEISASWSKVVGILGLNYLDIRAEENSLGSADCLLSKKIEWDSMIDLMGKTAMGSNDAMIGNVFLSSKMKVFATTDFDMAYGLAAENDNQCVAIPDAMFKRNDAIIKKIVKRKPQ